MQQEYKRVRQKQESASTLTGIILTVGIHVLACATLGFTGIKYIYPPPPESTFVLDFEEEKEPEIKQDFRGSQPKAETIDRTKEIELVQKSESPYKTMAKANTTPATKPDNFGDVDVPTPKQEPKLDPRAAFPGMSKKDSSTTAPHSAKEASESFKAGQPDGNARVGKTEGVANAHLKGRNSVGSLPRPAYGVQKEGIVVVTIKVDIYGNVVDAQPGATGTTVSDDKLWAAARSAAMKAHFTPGNSETTPALQEGTITYKFKLK
ncbi:MAG: hypothetical protein K5984_05555 [Bacteroidales bacterium]|nr:hypothetical protein [Bacteroidales bacterium]